MRVAFRNSTGFTLTEVLVALAVSGIVLTLVTLTLTNQQKASKGLETQAEWNELLQRVTTYAQRPSLCTQILGKDRYIFDRAKTQENAVVKNPNFNPITAPEILTAWNLEGNPNPPPPSSPIAVPQQNFNTFVLTAVEVRSQGESGTKQRYTVPGDNNPKLMLIYSAGIYLKAKKKFQGLYGGDFLETKVLIPAMIVVDPQTQYIYECSGNQSGIVNDDLEGG